MGHAPTNERDWTGVLQSAPVLLPDVSAATLRGQDLSNLPTDQLWFSLRFLFNHCAPVAKRITPFREVDFSYWRTNPAKLKALVIALVRELCRRENIPDHANSGLAHVSRVCAELWPQQRELLP